MPAEWTDEQHIALVAAAGCSHAPLFATDHDGRPLRAWCWRCKVEIHERGKWAPELAETFPPLQPSDRIVDADAFMDIAELHIMDLMDSEDHPDTSRERLIASLRVRDRLCRKGVLAQRSLDSGSVVLVYGNGERSGLCGLISSGA